MLCRKYIVADTTFIIISIVFVVFAYLGNADLTPNGIGLDSDLQNYTQILEWGKQPALFTHDPLAHTFDYFPGLPNLMTTIAGFFSGETYQTLLKAGAVSIFIFLLTFYILGRYLFTKPSIAALLAVIMSINVTWAYGTFWGATHSDPVPRILASAIFPLILLCGIYFNRNILIKCLLMVTCGLAIGIHSITGVALGAMFFFPFLMINTKILSLNTIKNGIILGISFLMPALVIIKNMHLPQSNLTETDIYNLKKIWNFRFEQDFSDLIGSLLSKIYLYFVEKPIFTFSIICLLFIYIKRNLLAEKVKILLKYNILFIIGLVIILLFVTFEMSISNKIGRIQISSDLLRGTKFLIPICWFFVITAVYIVDKKINIAVPILIITITAIFCFSIDKQILAVRHLIAKSTNIEMIESPKAQKMIKKNNEKLEALLELKSIVPSDSLVFTDIPDMSIRYFCHIPLFPVKQDGDNLYFDNDIENGLQWLKVMLLLYSVPPRAHEAWVASEAQYYFSNSSDCQNLPEDIGKILYSKNNWSICSRN